MKLPPQVRASMYRCILRREASRCLKHVFLSTCIWQVYIRYMYVISIQLDSSSSAARFRACLVSLARRDASDSDFLWILSVLITERPPIRGWGLPSHPGVDLINMAAPAWSLACTQAVSTSEFEGLYLSRRVFVWNGRNGVAIKKAWKEWHPPKTVLCPASIESRDRRGFIQFPNPVRPHGARCLNCKTCIQTSGGKNLYLISASAYLDYS